MRDSSILLAHEVSFSCFQDIDSLFSQGIELPPDSEHETEKGYLGAMMPRLVKSISGDRGHVLHFETPETMSRTRFFWFRDEEFLARQTFAGLNPYSIKLVTTGMAIKDVNLHLMVRHEAVEALG
ncbi:Lipoxygenase, C-terminal [Sesbania bispinosa]|nr:Lipoxygenase, C-terminal [Sesbania bispinosa]